MAIAPPTTAFVRPDGLAVSPVGVVRSRLDMPVAETQAKLKRAKERLYVLCQMGGWGMFLFLQVVFTHAVADNANRAGRDQLTDLATFVMVIMMGVILTHYARPFMTRWGWKDLGWRPLIPRVLGMAALLSFLWSGLGYGYTYLIVGLPWPGKASPLLILLISWLNGAGLLVGWLCFYFFYHIFERLNRMQVEQLRMAANVKEAELRALKSQVNPHFLFNSLNSLRALIDEDAPRAREAVTRLANMLRYSLQSGQLETVPFEEELRIVEDYVALEQIRHENRLQVRWDITEEVRARALPVPPMLLQTLVENAVKYGIGTRREGGEIVIAARIDGAVLRIRVTNPGELDAPVSAATARAGSSTGVGLRNASERLKLLFGDRASLALLAEPRGCVTADVNIPLNFSNK
jgi:signal transduction histidine kinase